MNVQSPSRYQKGLQALFFDMDDTMTKTMGTHFRAWTDLCLNHRPKNISLDYSAGISPHNIATVEGAYTGCTSEEFISILFGKLPQREVQALSEERDDLFIKQANNLEEIRGLTVFLEMLGTIKRGIASSTSRKGIEHVLEKLNIGRFFKPEHIIDPSKVSRGKPNPDPYLAAAKALDVSPENCLVFEDSRGGIQAAQSANMRIVGIATSISKPELMQLGVSRAINDYTEIKSLDELRELFNVLV